MISNPSFCGELGPTVAGVNEKKVQSGVGPGICYTLAHRSVGNLWFGQSRDEQATPSLKGGLSTVTPRYSSGAARLSSKHGNRRRRRPTPAGTDDTHAGRNECDLFALVVWIFLVVAFLFWNLCQLSFFCCLWSALFRSWW